MSDKDKNQFTLDTEGTGWKARVRRAVLGTVDAATLNLFDVDQRGAVGFQLDLNKRKVSLSIKLLEEIEKKEALEKYGSEGSGKNLPFSSLSDDLKKKNEDKD